MIYRGPGSLEVVRFGTSSPPFPSLSLSILSLFLSLPVCCRASFRTGEWGRGGGGEKANQKVWHSINYSILSDLMLLYAVGQKYLVDATAEVAGGEKVWHSINH
jgi:hypothetical protein